MVKKFSVFLCVFFFAIFAYAADGILWGAKNIRVVKTQWFDIIYEPESEECATVLYQNADRIYGEIADFFCSEPRVRMPVVISSKIEQSNAYYSSQYYNHIVLYNNPAIEELAVSSDDFLSTFYHELTHAFSYNMKNGFWAGVGNVLGDCVNPAGLFITSGWSEGATVSSESSKGEGRLNSEYSMHSVKQAKLENHFPSYSDIQGASDKYPKGVYYYFNGAFNEWLQKKYGLQKYSEFWYRCVNFRTLSAGLAFKKVYGIKLKSAWENFKNEMYVPAVLAPDEKPVKEVKNISGAVYSSLCSSQKGFAWIEKKSETVWFNGKKLFAVRGIEKISLSPDGRLLAVSYTDSSSANYKRKIKIYDFNKNIWYNVSEFGLCDAIISFSSEGYVLISKGFKGQNTWIDRKKILFDKKGKIIGFENLEAIDSTSRFTMPVSFAPQNLNGENYAYIKKNGTEYSLCVVKDSRLEWEFKAPLDEMVMTGLSCSLSGEEGDWYFSWTVSGSMPRLGKFNMYSHEYTLYKEDFLGGIFNPVRLADGRLLYESHFYRENKIFELNEMNLTKIQILADSVQPELITDTPEKNSKNENLKNSLADISIPYNPFVYTRGLLLPLSTMKVTSFDPLAKDYGKSSYLFVGASYLTNNPWNSDFLTITAGWNPFERSSGASVTLSGETGTQLFSWSAELQTQWKETNWNQSAGIGSFTFNFPFGNYSTLYFKNTATAAYLHQKNFLYLADSLNVYYSYVHKTGPGYLEKGGFALGIVQTFYTLNWFELERKIKGINYSPFMNIYIPKLLPFNCKDFFVYNLPATLRFTFSPTKLMFFNGSAEVCLFEMDFQKAVPFLSCLFLNRVYINGGYSWQMGGTNFHVNDSFYIEATIGMTPNIGIIANSLFYTEFFAKFEYKIRKSPAETQPIIISFGIQGSWL